MTGWRGWMVLSSPTIIKGAFSSAKFEEGCVSGKDSVREGKSGGRDHEFHELGELRRTCWGLVFDLTLPAPSLVPLGGVRYAQRGRAMEHRRFGNPMPVFGGDRRGLEIPGYVCHVC